MTAVNKKVDLQHSQEFNDIVGGIVAADYLEVAVWLADHRREYAAFVLEGARPLGKNFGGKEDPTPCADK